MTLLPRTMAVIFAPKKSAYNGRRRRRRRPQQPLSDSFIIIIFRGRTSRRAKKNPHKRLPTIHTYT